MFLVTLYYQFYLPWRRMMFSLPIVKINEYLTKNVKNFPKTQFVFGYVFEVSTKICISPDI